MRLIYLNSDNTSVMEAQVISLLEYYRNTNKFSDIILLQGFKSTSEKNVLKRKLNGFKSKIVWFKAWPGYTVFQYFAFSSISKVLDQLTLDDETIIHVRAELYGAIIHQYLCKKKIDIKFLVDLRGITFEEVDKYYLHNFLLKRNKILLFKKAYRKIDGTIPITVVSEAFKEYLIKQHGFSEQNICVHPNIAGEQFTFNQKLRQKIRKELGLYKNDIVAICSSSGANAWQKDKDVIMQIIALKIKVINLSSSQQEMPGVINKFVSFKSMPGYLAAADIAILWRDNNVVNEVASPSKFSEFAAMGLWVIHNDTVRIVADFIRQNNAGIIVKSINEITEKQISSFYSYDRQYYSTIGRKIFGVENIAKSYIMHYSKILQKEE
jgi:hypothetical protein